MDINIILNKKEKQNYNFANTAKSTTEEQREPTEKTEDADTNKSVIYI